MRLGLHRDDTTSEFSYYDTEMRRRLWWQICILDVRTAEDSGTDPSILECSFSTRFPSNVNDLDLDIGMSGPPTEIYGRTEMLFSLVRFEISYAARKVVFSKEFCNNNSYPIMNAEESCGFVDSLRQKLEDAYLKHCDMKIPLCYVTAYTARLILTKLKLVAFHSHQSSSSLLLQTTRDHLFNTSVEILEYSEALKSENSAHGWLWLFQDYVEWDALTYCLGSLCEQMLGEQVDRAWKIVNLIFDGWQSTVLDKPRERKWRNIEFLRSKALTTRHSGMSLEERDNRSLNGLGVQYPTSNHDDSVNMSQRSTESNPKAGAPSSSFLETNNTTASDEQYQPHEQQNGLFEPQFPDLPPCGIAQNGSRIVHPRDFSGPALLSDSAGSQSWNDFLSDFPTSLNQDIFTYWL